MSPVILPEIDGHLTVRALEGDTADGFALCRADCFPVVEVAIVHDGSDRGVGETEAYVALLARSPGMKRLLDEAVAFEAEAFDEERMSRCRAPTSWTGSLAGATEFVPC